LDRGRRIIDGTFNDQRAVILLIITVTLLFNLYSVFGLHLPMKDDFLRYSWALEADFSRFSWSLFHFPKSVLSLLYKLMPVSLYLPRLIVLVFAMVPISIIIYFFLDNHTRVPRYVSFAAAVLPNILPGRVQLPTFINGNYTVIALLLFLGALVCFDRFLRRERIIPLSLGGLCFLAALLFSEQILFLLPPVFFGLFLRSERRSLRPYAAAVVIGALSAARVGMMMMVQARESARPAWRGLSTVWERLFYYLKMGMPFPFYMSQNHAWVLPAGIVGFLAVCFILSRLFPRRVASAAADGEKGRLYGWRLYALALMWYACSIAPFICLARDIAPRYSYIGAFGLVCVGLTAAERFFRRVLSPAALASIMLVIVIGSGLERNLNQFLSFHPQNRCHAFLQKRLGGTDWPRHAQIVIIGDCPINTGGMYLWSSGYLRFVFQRKDISGILPKEYAFYNPFEKKPWGKMKNLDPARPLFAYRIKDTKKVIPYRYALIWRGDTRRSPWDIISMAPRTGAIRFIRRGHGLTAFRHVLSELKTIGISRSDILWASARRARIKIR